MVSEMNCEDSLRSIPLLCDSNERKWFTEPSSNPISQLLIRFFVGTREQETDLPMDDMGKFHIHNVG